MSIALLCPTRARPDQCRRMVSSVIRTTDEPIQVDLALSEADGANYSFAGVYGQGQKEPNVNVTLRHMPDGMPTAFKWNLLAEEAFKNSNNKLFMLASDDIVFTTPCWDKALLGHYHALENKIHVYHLRDSRNPDGTPHPIVTREWVEAMGYFLPPLFLHWFVDSWTVEIARANNCFTHLRDYMLEHIKPSDVGQPDETHSRIRDWGWHARDKWASEKCQHYLEYEKRRLKEKIIESLSMEQRALTGTKAW